MEPCFDGELDEATPDECLEVRGRSRRDRRVEQLLHVAGRELTPSHRGPLEDGALARTEPIEARREQGPERGRRLEQPGLPHVRDELLEEERIALRRRDQT